MIKCPNCGYSNVDTASYCENCGRELRPARRPLRRQLAEGEKAWGRRRTDTTRGELRPWVIVALIMAIIGAFFIFMGFWVVGLPLIIAAGYFAYTQGSEIVPRVALLLSAASLFWINIIPENQLISAIGVTIAFMSIILMLPEPEKKTPTLFIVGLGALFLTIGWTLFCTISITNDLISILAMVFIDGGLVLSSVVWKSPIGPTVKIIGTTVCFLPVIILGARFLFIWGSVSLGGVIDRVQMMLGEDILSGTALDMILNPTLAVQAGLKPATQKEITETTGPPTLAFTVSGSVIPESGCYDDSSFQLIAKITNTGGDYISDLKLEAKAKKVEAPLLLDIFPNPCGINHIHHNCGEWNINALPQGVTLSQNCLVERIDDTGDIVDWLSLGLLEEQVTPTHTCFFDIIASTGYHSVSRLPVEMVEENYGRNKFEQRQLVQRVVPSTTSVGPVDLSLGGFEQPILHLDNGSKVTMITTISQSGPGRVQDYKSAYLFIPNKLLERDGDEYKCAGSNDDWECISDLGDTSDLGSNTPERRHYTAFLEFKNDEEIGGFKQFEYDLSDNLLDEGYSICFLKRDIDTLSLITTGTCTLNIKDVLEESDLRKTLIIRGDVLYTYNISTPIGITVRDCNI